MKFIVSRLVSSTIQTKHGNHVVFYLEMTSFPPFESHMEIMLFPYGGVSSWKECCFYPWEQCENDKSHHFQANFKLHSKQVMETTYFPCGHHMVST